MPLRSCPPCLVLLAVLTVAIVPATAAPAPLPPAPPGTPAAALDAFHRAAAEADGDAYFDLLADDGVFIGTDATERWSKAAFEVFCRPYFDADTGWTYVPTERFLDVDADAGLAWFHERLHNAKYGTCRGTGVLRREDGAWRIVQYALSIPLPNELAGTVVTMIATAASAAREPAWALLDARTDASLRGLSVPAADVAWTSGANGTVRRTVDGGRTWRGANPPPSGPGTGALDYRDVHAFDADRAVVMSAGSPARIHRTEDGGVTWTTVHRDDRPEIFLDAIAFWDEAHGLAFGDPIDGRTVILRTDDGGRSWRAVPREAIPPARAGEAGFAASGTGLALVTTADGTRRAWIGLGGGDGGEAARVLASGDGGRTWTAAASPMAASASAGVFSMAWATPARGVAVGGDHQRPSARRAHAMHTRDGGRTWLAPAVGRGPRGYRSAATAVPGRGTILAVGPTGTDATFDGGATWHALSDAGFHAVAASPDGAAVYASGADGRVARLESPELLEARALDATIAAIYACISGPPGAARDWARFRSLFAPDATLGSVRPDGRPGERLSVDAYVERADRFMRERGFHEIEIDRRVERFGRVAQVTSAYETRLGADPDRDAEPDDAGVNGIQLVLGPAGWQVVSILWDRLPPAAD